MHNLYSVYSFTHPEINGCESSVLEHCSFQEHGSYGIIGLVNRIISNPVGTSRGTAPWISKLEFTHAKPEPAPEFHIGQGIRILIPWDCANHNIQSINRLSYYAARVSIKAHHVDYIWGPANSKGSTIVPFSNSWDDANHNLEPTGKSSIILCSKGICQVTRKSV